jgi:hypothetical protein
VILGPDKRQNHHLARALHGEDVKQVLVTVLENLSGLEPEAFWFVLENRGLTHPYDENGRRRACADIPRSVRGLIDDPFRYRAMEQRPNSRRVRAQIICLVGAARSQKIDAINVLSRIPGAGVYPRPRALEVPR